ncbi:MAG: DUF1254 domain-containing protein [Bauldia sp.]|nr:DUF1254 domain-containing protein [Bauldia sp.]
MIIAPGLRHLGAGLLALSTLMTVPPVLAAEPGKVTSEEAREIGLDAYLYFYPLISMDLTRKQTTNIEAGKEIGRGPMNAFSNVETYPPADFKTVVRPNFDTLYSSAWLDMTDEPVVVSAPDTDGRFYLLPMLDMWTDIFASPGWRTTGTGAADFLVTPPGWNGEVPEGTIRIAAPTPYVWIIGRTKTDGPQDYDAVHAIQTGFKIVPLSKWGTDWSPPTPTIDPKVDMVTAPKLQADRMSADTFFAYAAELMKVVPPHATDEPIIARLKRIGFEPGKSFDLAAADPVVAEALRSAPREGQKLMAWKMPTIARVANGWSMNTESMGVYGSNYLKRAAIAQWGLGANLPEDAIYPSNLYDDEGKPLDGANDYTIHFAAGQTPPVGSFWSITLYDAEGFQVANPLDRFALSSWNSLRYDADGSLELNIQSENPGPEREANWLPTPKGPFNLLLRMYAPKSDAIVGKWDPPPVVRNKATVAPSAQ